MPLPILGIRLRIAEEFEEGGGEEGVGEFEGAAAGAAQPVRLLQTHGGPLLLWHDGKGISISAT